MSSFIDLTGNRFGRWTVLERDTSKNKKNIYWICKCDCGTIRSVAGTSLRSGISVSCGCEKDEKTSIRTRNSAEDLTGKRFGKWVVLRRDLSDNQNSKRGARWICRCDCGTEKSVLGYSLKFGRSTSCGCDNRNRYIDLTGQRYGKLTVLRRDTETNHKGKSVWWICQCDCGNIVSVSSGRLRSGQTQSCGCLRYAKRERQTDDLVGKQFGFWTVLSKDSSKKRESFYICQCKCGTIKSVSASSLKRGLSQSCGCKRSVPKDDLTGKRFGFLTVLGVDEDNKKKRVYWKCQCDCGNIKSYQAEPLISGRVKSCGCMSRTQSAQRQFKDIKGKRFGRLVVLDVDHKETDNCGNTSYFWRCQCDCGNEIVVIGDSLRNGSTQSCGCLQAEASAKRAKERTIDLTGRRFGLLTVIERVELDDSGMGYGLWKCQCDCGNIKLADGHFLRIGAICSCGCLSQSKYELFVLQYFEEKGYENAIDYEYQKRFSELRGYGGKPLSYDFAFYVSGELKYLIECQGQQHYKPIPMFGGEEQFAKQQLHDEEKRSYAEKINATLIEIPYTVESIEDVRKILLPYGI